MTNARYRRCLIWGDDMNSIDNLRDYVLTAPSICSTTRAILVGYIDGIEREVVDMRDFCERLDDAATKREDVTLWGVDYTALPVDADGVPIHVGDVMELAGGNVEKVESLHNYGSEGWSATTTNNATVIPWSTRHHHAPTVEDVLREFAERLDEIGSEDDCVGVDEKECRACIRRDIAAAYAEYAAKLRLANSEE